ncbi:hypothetical protein N7537_008873 [Penicillium hordei]|uniref:NmrA-like domain-containing protein n=1 Tax=Penicillium hordei TaxID=40994 RepID=A0AAD6H185_9EURO|nr:uncharacterized protein N7537_008873 [Penicillium hordei]KAJ5598789.1 hypothetical protein N7537_008873 [Penicillium hordei]
MPTLSQEFKIRGITRDASKPVAQALVKQGVEVKTPLSLVTTPDWGNAGSDAELVHGKNVADAAKEAGVQHLIFSSLLNVTETSGGRLKHVPHFDQKATVEYIRSVGVPATFVLPGYFMTNYTVFRMLRKGDDGVYNLADPVGKDAHFPPIDIAGDMGKYVAAALKNRSEVLCLQLLAAADYYSPTRILAAFIPGPLGQEMLENHLFSENPGYFNGKSLKESYALLEKSGYRVTSWEDFLKQCKDSL